MEVYLELWVAVACWWEGYGCASYVLHIYVRCRSLRSSATYFHPSSRPSRLSLSLSLSWSLFLFLANGDVVLTWRVFLLDRCPIDRSIDRSCRQYVRSQEYELQRQLMLKLKCLGVNAAFSLRSDVSQSDQVNISTILTTSIVLGLTSLTLVWYHLDDVPGMYSARCIWYLVHAYLL